MQWYEGLIPEAIAQAKRNKALFVVYIAGDDEESKKMDQTWLDESVSQICQNAKCVGLRIDAKSDVCRQFNQIYPVVVIPSTFFIGNSGLPVEVLGGFIPPEDFKQKIAKVIDLHGDKVGSESPVASSTEDSADLHSTGILDLPSAHSPAAESGASSDLNDNGEIYSNSASLEEKLDRARKLIDERKKEKDEQLKQDEIKKEVERRKVGQDMTKIKRFRDEAEVKELADKISKERAADKAAKEKILKQIAEDREEKRRRYDSNLEAAEKAKEEAKAAKLLNEQQEKQALLASRRSNSRIQFRLPDGSSITTQFSADSQFGEARQFISQHVGYQFTLSTSFPRRDYTIDYDNQTFRQLLMVPSAVIIVLPNRTLISSYRSESSAANWFWFILTPVIFLLNLLNKGKSSLFSRLTSGANLNHSSATNNTASGSNPSTDRSSSSAYKRKNSFNNGRSTISRREGNIHRFTNTDDDNDENNTWNGNSTQQM